MTESAEKRADYEAAVRPLVTMRAVKKRARNLTVRIIEHVSGFDALEKDWNQLTDHTNSHIYQTFDWNRIWWKYFGTGKKLSIITFYDDQKLIGLVPLFCDTISVFGVRLYSCLRFIGSIVSQPKGEPLLGNMSYSSYLDIIIWPGYEKKVYSRFKTLMTEILTKCDQMIFDEVPQDSNLLEFIESDVPKEDIQINVEEASVVSSAHLDSSWDDYLSTLSKNSRSHARRALKRVEHPKKKIFDVWNLESWEELPRRFDQFVQMHQQRWNRRGQPGAFRKQRMYNFYKAVTHKFFENGWLQLTMAVPVGEEQGVAIDLNFRYKNRLYGEHCALDDQSEYYQHGPGTSLLYATLREAACGQSVSYDFGRGAYGYKNSKATEVATNKKITLAPVSKVSKWKVTLFDRLVTLKRRVNREAEQLRLFFDGQPPRKALAEYYSFMRERISPKRI